MAQIATLRKPTPHQSPGEKIIEAYVMEQFLCGAAVVGAIIGFGGLLFPPAAMGAAFIFWAVGATLTPTLIAAGIVGACF